jgi:hypothetical protein
MGDCNLDCNGRALKKPQKYGTLLLDAGRAPQSRVGAGRWLLQRASGGDMDYAQ